MDHDFADEFHPSPARPPLPFRSALTPDPEPVKALERLGDRIATLAAHLEAATSRLLDLLREFDAREGWNTGFTSCAHWLSYRTNLDLGAARERVRVARALGGLPRLHAAFARGELSYAKVRALTRVATPAIEERLLKVGQSGTCTQVERLVRGWRRVDRNAEAQDEARRQRGRTLKVYQDADGMVVVQGRLTPEAGAVLMKALEAARERLFSRPEPGVALTRATEPPTWGQQQADALGLIAESALHGPLDPGAPGERYQVVVHVDAAPLADPDAPGQSVLEGGTHVSIETSRRLACDATRVVLRHDADGRVVEVGARTRTIPPALRRALHHRDQGCRFPGCSVRYGQGHHLRHWASGGPTTLSNLAMLCRRHHRAVHEEGYQVERGEDGELQFTLPTGFPFPAVAPPAGIPDDPVEALVEANAAQGLEIDARTGRPGWDGTPLNVGYAIDVLHPRATGELANSWPLAGWRS